FFVGSLGRFGALVELTFKVFPAPAATLTLKLSARDSATAAKMLVEAANSRCEPDALDILPGTNDVCLRLAGPAPALETIANEILARWPGEKLTPNAADELWTSLREFLWAHPQGPLIKVPITTGTLPAIVSAVMSEPEARIHVSSGGNVAFVSLPNEKGGTTLSDQLSQLTLSGLTIRGEGPLWCGVQRRGAVVQRVKDALDPQSRFPGFDE